MVDVCAAQLSITANIVVGVTVSGMAAQIASDYDDTFLLSDAYGCWIASTLGEEVSWKTMVGQNEYFAKSVIPDQGGVTLPANAVIGETSYFRFMVQNPTQVSEYYSAIFEGIQPNFIPDTYYGWVSYTVDAQGNLTFIESAIGLNGQSMIVGVIPEPSCAALLLFGTIALALRRPRQ